MTTVKDQETVVGNENVKPEQAVDFDKSPLASALFRHIEQYYSLPVLYQEDKVLENNGHSR